jgi:glucose-1-phosphate thymidylyltransferase
VKCLVLAAGYATRLRPLTDSVPKMLLPVGSRPMLDWVWDKIEELGLDDVHLVTNARFAPAFSDWARGRPVTVHDDGTTSNEDRLGAIGDVEFVVDRIGKDDDLLIIAGDNLFEFSLADYVAFWRGKGVASCIAVHDCGSLELARQYGVADLDADDRVLSLVEKPDQPRSTLVAIATYLLHREHVPLVGTYLSEGESPDQPGRLFVWLCGREPVYGYRFPGEWLDIGSPEQLLEADNRLRTSAGLPPRDAYTL